MENKWDKLTTKKVGLKHYTETLKEMVLAPFDWLYWNWPVFPIFGIPVIVGVVLFFSLTQKYKEIDGHKYVRTGIYNFSHSPDCWCE